MKKLYLILFGALLLTGCIKTDKDKAEALLDEARMAAKHNSFDHARELVDSLRNTYPMEVDVRKDALAFMDDMELQQAKSDLHVSDSIVTFKEFELSDLKKDFILEKQDRYQTAGYYVTKDFAGSKSAYNFFTEVEEDGNLLAVFISRTSGIRYDFSQIDIDFTSDAIPVCPIARQLTQKEQDSYEKCYHLAKCIQELDEANKSREKNNMKVRFFEQKIEKDKDVLSE